jgi:hypothetical protein
MVVPQEDQGCDPILYRKAYGRRNLIDRLFCKLNKLAPHRDQTDRLA